MNVYKMVIEVVYVVYRICIIIVYNLSDIDIVYVGLLYLFCVDWWLF